MNYKCSNCSVKALSNWVKCTALLFLQNCFHSQTCMISLVHTYGLPFDVTSKAPKEGQFTSPALFFSLGSQPPPLLAFFWWQHLNKTNTHFLADWRAFSLVSNLFLYLSVGKQNDNILVLVIHLFYPSIHLHSVHNVHCFLHLCLHLWADFVEDLYNLHPDFATSFCIFIVHSLSV